MTSNARQAYVWVWLPRQKTPVVAGQIALVGEKYHFVYGRSYLAREDAISFSPLELPLQKGTFEPQGMNAIHASLRDAAPDAWGRRVIGYKYPELQPNELDYMLLSASQRIGALDFQQSSDHYEPRDNQHSTLLQLMQAAELVEKRQTLPPELDMALLHGTSVGGARPKALIEDDTGYYIAKFSASADYYDVVKAEYVAMRLAKLSGINVANVSLLRVMDKDVLLVERFDRQAGFRQHILSALSLLQLNEMEARYASYQQLANLIRASFRHPKETLKELYKRIVFNILIGNTDDHARNHAAFWDGHAFNLTPAYDLCPQLRSGREATQAMQLNGSKGNFSTLPNALSICPAYFLDTDEAKQIITHLEQTIKTQWHLICEEADLGQAEKQRLWGSAILNPFCYEGWSHLDN